MVLDPTVRMRPVRSALQHFSNLTFEEFWDLPGNGHAHLSRMGLSLMLFKWCSRNGSHKP